LLFRGRDDKLVSVNHSSGRDLPTRITDPKAVAAITHPLRMRLLGELARHGTARGKDLAELLDEPANSVSFHLRQLARYGLIEPDPDQGGDRRERWWRQTSDRGFYIDLAALRAQAGGEAAVNTLRRVAEGHVVALHRASRAQCDDGPEGDLAVSTPPRSISRDFAVWLDDQELEAMRAELDAVLEKWSERSRDRGGSARAGRGRRGYYGVLLAAPEDEMFRVYAQQGERR